MRYVSVCFGLLLAIVNVVTLGFPAQAISTSIVISQVQTGGSGTSAAGQEFIELYNNAMQDIDVTGWCITYSSAADGAQSNVVCLTPPDTKTTVWLRAHTYATFVSNDYKTATGIGADGLFSYNGGMATTAGHVRVVDSAKNEIDRLAWGSTAVHPETTMTTAPAGGISLYRVGQGVLQDTDNNSVDFSLGTPLIRTGGIDEETVLVDICPNIPDIQETVPFGYMQDGAGNCQVDVCTNLAGLQISVPDGYDGDVNGVCTLHDECPNLAGIQAVLPDGYTKQSDGACSLYLVSLQITELLANAAGSDTGHEFIELYNPTDETISLTNYRLAIGTTTIKQYAFPVGSVLAPHAYTAFYDSDIPFTLVNTSGGVALLGSDGTIVDAAVQYTDPNDDMAWALIDGLWQYTNQPTPGAANLASKEDDDTAVATITKILAACPTGKYRNPLTNRCRTIESDASVLAACDDDQYRNPETGRCKKITVASSLTPCKEGQYRSEDTNRCRAIATASTSLTPCKTGQERNPDTNRCRTVTKSIPAAAYTVEPLKEGIKAFAGWWAIGGVGTAAAGYAAWEWRSEMSRWLRRIIHRG